MLQNIVNSYCEEELLESLLPESLFWPIHWPLSRTSPTGNLSKLLGAFLVVVVGTGSETGGKAYFSSIAKALAEIAIELRIIAEKENKVKKLKMKKNWKIF